jgi:hypothetical protein
MQIKDCSSPGRPEDQPVACSNAILTCRRPQCGGGVASASDYLHGIIQQVERLKVDLYQVRSEVPPPGKASVMACSACGGRAAATAAASAKCSDAPVPSAAISVSITSMAVTKPTAWSVGTAADSSGRQMIRIGWHSDGGLASRQPERLRRQPERQQFLMWGGTAIECNASTKETYLACGGHCRLGTARAVAGRNGGEWLHSL